MVYKRERDAKRMALFPSLDYRGLYTVLVQLLEVTPLIQVGTDGTTLVMSLILWLENIRPNQICPDCDETVVGQSLISTILCVLPFLEQDLIDNLPSLVASSLVHLPPSLHGHIVQVLCYFLLPLTMGKRVPATTHSFIRASLLMTVFRTLLTGRLRRTGCFLIGLQVLRQRKVRLT